MIYFICIYKIKLIASIIKFQLLFLKIIKIKNNYIILRKLEIVSFP